MDANGGWIASAVDLVRFGAALDDPKRCPILSEDSIRTMLAPPPGAVGHDPSGRPKATYYACGWNVRPSVRRSGTPLTPLPIPIARRRISLHRQDVAGLGRTIEMQLDTASVELTQHHLDTPLDRRMVRAVAGDEFRDNGPQCRGRQ
jgi:hypothetical protein